MIEQFAIDAMQKDGMSVSIEDDGEMAVVECREYADEVIDTGEVHQLARQHGVIVERVLGDFSSGALTVHIVTAEAAGNAEQPGGDRR